MNTMAGRKWGSGNESPSLFDPKKLDAEQWVKAIKSAGMKGLILTCKHHDGFCLWQTELTAHSVALSPWKVMKGDVIREVFDACKKRDKVLRLPFSQGQEQPLLRLWQGVRRLFCL